MYAHTHTHKHPVRIQKFSKKLEATFKFQAPER